MLISKQIEQKVDLIADGNLIFISDFVPEQDYEVARKVLQRLCNRQELIRLSRGIYYKPQKDNLIGIILPSAEQIAQAIAKRDKARIIPTGSYALYKLGLSTQIPMNVVYLTDGSPRKVEVGTQKIMFKKTNPKSLAVKHNLSSLIIQGLKELGENAIDNKIKEQIKEVIKRSGEQSKVQESMSLAPVWIQKVVSQIITNA